MNVQRASQTESTTNALQYANKQIDQFVARGRLTFSELALIVEALYAMSRLSGSTVFAYALLSRAKILLLDDRGFFTINDHGDAVDHQIPQFLRDLPFYLNHMVKGEHAGEFVPLFALDLDANTVVLKNTIWVRSQEKKIYLPVALGANAVDAFQVDDNKHCAVAMPVLHMQHNKPRCAIIQVPAGVFDEVREMVDAGHKTIKLRKSFGSQKPGVEARSERAILPHITDWRAFRAEEFGDFWKGFTAYAGQATKQNAGMPKNVVDAITHTLIAIQKPLPELSATMF